MRLRGAMMKTLCSITLVIASLGVTAAAAAWAQSSPAIKPLYGTTTFLAQTSEFAIAATAPTLQSPRSQYVVLAEANDDKDLEVLAWHDTTSSLDPVSGYGIADHEGVVSVAVTGLDSSRVVTADINEEGVLSIHTWKIGPGGIVSQRGYRTPRATASQDVAMATLSDNEVVTAYETTEGSLEVDAWTIAEDGLPVPMTVVGKGPKAFEVSIAAISPNQVVTAAGDSKQALWVNTWEINSAGVKPLDQVETKTALSTLCFLAPRSQTVAVGAGRSFERLTSNGSTQHDDLVREAFTPVVTPECQVQIYSWGVSGSGVLSRQSITSLTQAGDFGDVAASMLPRNKPMTFFSGGTGDNHVYVEGYTGPDFAGNPYGVLNIATTAAGTDFSELSLFSPYNAYFITAAQYGPEESVPDGTLFINVLSYLEAPVL
jgi:hypothetical protein